MSDEIEFEGVSYVSSKRAASLTGYAQDYIGQLARRGSIEARRIGGLWYVFLPSLENYKNNPDATSSKIPTAGVPNAQGEKIDADGSILFNEIEFISASRASQITGYNQDYVGQLARSGKIAARQVGNRWYVGREELLSHKYEKDSLLAAVQASSVGILKDSLPSNDAEAFLKSSPLLDYNSIPEEFDLKPDIQKNDTSSREIDFFDNTIKINSLVMKSAMEQPAPSLDIRKPIYLNNKPHILRFDAKESAPLKDDSYKDENAAQSGSSSRRIIYMALLFGILIVIVVSIFITICRNSNKSIWIKLLDYANTAIYSFEQYVSPELVYNR